MSRGPNAARALCRTCGLAIVHNKGVRYGAGWYHYDPPPKGEVYDHKPVPKGRKTTRVVGPRARANRIYKRIEAELQAKYPEKRIPYGTSTYFARKFKKDRIQVSLWLTRHGYSVMPKNDQDYYLGSVRLHQILEAMDKLWEIWGRKGTMKEVGLLTGLNPRVIENILTAGRRRGAFDPEDPKYTSLRHLKMWDKQSGREV